MPVYVSGCPRAGHEGRATACVPRRLWAGLLGVEKTTVEWVRFDEREELLVAGVRPTRGERGRCGVCRRRCPGYDGGQGRRRWRALDLGVVRAVLEADAPRVCCPEHGVVVAAVPWARHGAGHTRFFDDQVAWLAVTCSKSAVIELMRIAWRTVGAIVTRVAADATAGVDRLAGVRRIGIDEISYKKGQRYLTVVVDHDTRRLVWAAPGPGPGDLGPLLRPARRPTAAPRSPTCRRTRRTGSPMSSPSAARTRSAAPTPSTWWRGPPRPSTRSAGRPGTTPRALARTEPRRGRGRPPADAPARPGHERAGALKHARYALWKNPEDLTERQTAKLAWIATTDPRLYRAYLLKEGLRHVFKAKRQAGIEALDRWLSWAARCRIPAFVALGRRIRKHRASIDAALEHDLSNALIEATNTKIRLLQRIAFGFKSADAAHSTRHARPRRLPTTPTRPRRRLTGPEPTLTSPLRELSARTGVRRAASASRTYGRCAVGLRADP